MNNGRLRHGAGGCDLQHGNANKDRLTPVPGWELLGRPWPMSGENPVFSVMSAGWFCEKYGLIGKVEDVKPVLLK